MVERVSEATLLDVEALSYRWPGAAGFTARIAK